MTGFGRDPIPGIGTPAPTNALTPETAALCLQNGPGAGRLFPLNKLRNHVGRSDPPAIIADIDLAECEMGNPPMVSRRHAELQWVAGRLQVIDMMSTNGTCVNGQPLPPRPGRPSAPVPLNAGDTVRFANLDFEVRLLPERA